MCQEDYKSKGGEPCKPCPDGTTTNGKRGSPDCPGLTKGMTDRFNKIFKILDQQKEKTNDLSIKNSRLWQKEQIRIRHDMLMEARKQQDDINEKSSCETQRDRGTVIFPAVEISIEMEKIEDTTCIDTNRDELLKSFCSFTSDLDNLFQIQNIDKEAKTFWPNICCKERRDTTLEACIDPREKIKRENIIPFALSQGGNYSRHNLYVEVTDTIKVEGYLHKGMLGLLNSLNNIKRQAKANAKARVKSFFEGISLCGPRIVDKPGNPETKLCELFVPYKHAMRNFYELIENLYAIPIPQQEGSLSFMETMEQSLLNRQVPSVKTRLGKNDPNTFNLNPAVGAAMKSKSKSTDKQKEACSSDLKFGPTELAKMKSLHCKGSSHLDLSNANVKNIAIYYLKDEMSKYYKNYTVSIAKKIRYDVVDKLCSSKLFNAKDISIQQVAMDTLGKEKEWVAVVHLNTEDINGYLQSELPYCKIRKYLIGANVEVKAYIDNENCCNGLRDYHKCIDAGCETKLIPLKDINNKDFSRDVKLTGSDYIIKDTHHYKRRRRLFVSTGSVSGSCANRL
jgi:hypothetical protein